MGDRGGVDGFPVVVGEVVAKGGVFVCDYG